MRPRGSSKLGAIAPLVPVGLACGFDLVVLHSETTPAHNLNDSAFHLEMVRWADQQIGRGRVPLDGWFPDLSLGSSFFHHYQSLPYTLTAFVARATHLGDQTTYLWIQYLLLALWPVAVFVGARLLGMEQWQAGAAALVSPLLVSVTGYGYEHGSYTWQGYGLYTQLFGMWLLPIAWGCTWRAVSKGSSYALATFALALTIATHLLTGYLAVLTVGVWVVVAGRGIARRAARAVLVVVAGLLTAAWVLVPLLADRNFAAQSVYYRGTLFDDSYGARKITGWLVSGQLFDHGRFPVVTLLLGVGLVTCAVHARHGEPARALLGTFAFSLVLFFGRATWGAATDALPGNGDLQMHRFIAGVHLAGILLAGVGAVTVGRGVVLVAARVPVRRGRELLVRGAVVVVLVSLLVPAWVDRGRYDLHDAKLISAQRRADATDGADLAALITRASARGDGRIYSGSRGNWGAGYRVGLVPAHVEMSNASADAIGFFFRTVQSLSTDIEAGFDEHNLAQYQMMNVRYLILPSDRPPPVPAQLIARSGRHRLYEVDTSGYFQVVDVVGSVSADRANIAAATAAFRDSSDASNDRYPAVAFDGARAAAPTLTGPAPPRQPPGRVLSTPRGAGNDPADGVFTARVHATRRAAVLLKETFDPRWEVTVDGKRATAVMLAPSLVGVEVPAGTHVVTFRYRPYPDYPLLLAIGALVLIVLAFRPWRRQVGATSRSAAASRTAP